MIREEIGDAKFCILVDEARDQSKREQMSLVLRLVDNGGFIQEHFFGVVHVQDTKALTLKNAIFSVLSQHALDVRSIRGQGYDGASNMRGEWNGLQALIAKECPCAYYVHCFAHSLQLALVAASRDVKPVHNFFGQLAFIVNVLDASSKRHDELQVAKAKEISHLISQNEPETGRGLNQVGTLKRAGDTRWSSQLKSISSLLKMFNATHIVLNNISDDWTSAHGDADSALEMLSSFEFIFVLHVMKEIMEITDVLCQALQRKSQDISNDMNLVSTTKDLLQQLRRDGWHTLFTKVKIFCEILFCEIHKVEIPDMSTRYVPRRGRARNQIDDITLEHYHRVDIFYSAVDTQ